MADCLRLHLTPVLIAFVYISARLSVLSSFIIFNTSLVFSSVYFPFFPIFKLFLINGFLCVLLLAVLVM